MSRCLDYFYFILSKNEKDSSDFKTLYNEIFYSVNNKVADYNKIFIDFKTKNNDYDLEEFKSTIKEENTNRILQIGICNLQFANKESANRDLQNKENLSSFNVDIGKEEIFNIKTFSNSSFNDFVLKNKLSFQFLFIKFDRGGMENDYEKLIERLCELTNSKILYFEMLYDRFDVIEKDYIYLNKYCYWDNKRNHAKDLAKIEFDDFLNVYNKDFKIYINKKDLKKKITKFL